MNANEKRRLANTLSRELDNLSKYKVPLPGINNSMCKEIFVRQLLDSISRVKYAQFIANRRIDVCRTDPLNKIFDPLYSAVYLNNTGDIENACWLVFLSTHFGKSKKSGWLLVREIIGGCTGSFVWTWENISQNPEEFKNWYSEYYDAVIKKEGNRFFNNHRKYQTLDPKKKFSPPAIFQSYIDWVLKFDSHKKMFNKTMIEASSCREKAFNLMYKDMKVMQFSRMGKFDYLTMIAKLGIVDLEPDSAYLSGSTGPKKGAAVLFGKGSIAEYEEYLKVMRNELSIGDIGMQVLEDAICNWQKSTKRYIRFSG